MSNRGSGTVKNVDRKNRQTETYNGQGRSCKMEAPLPVMVCCVCRSGFDGGFPLNGYGLFDVRVQADRYRAGVRNTFQFCTGRFVR